MGVAWDKKNPWYQNFRNARRRCTDKNFKSYYLYGGRGIKFLLTVEDIKSLWIRDSAHLLKIPSLDRIDSDKDYILNNCRFIEKHENSKGCSKKKMVKVIQIDSDGKQLKTWDSMGEAENTLGICKGSISRVVRNKGNHKTAKGFYWKLDERKL